MSFVIPTDPITRQELIDAVAAMYAAFFHTGTKTAIQFNAIDLAAIAMQRARECGLVVACEAKDPLPPRIDLPLFLAMDV